jgi:hypothetical protein
MHCRDLPEPVGPALPIANFDGKSAPEWGMMGT